MLNESQIRKVVLMDVLKWVVDIDSLDAMKFGKMGAPIMQGHIIRYLERKIRECEK